MAPPVEVMVMRKLAFLLVLFSLLWPATALGNPSRVSGSWRIVAFKDGTERQPLPKGLGVLLVFDHKTKTWEATVSTQNRTHNSSGTWSMKRNVLTMEYKGRKTQMIATPGTDTLTLGLRNRPSRRFVAIRAVKK